MSPEECAARIAPTVGDLGARFMLHAETMEAGKEAGYPNGFAYYMAGRGGVLGDVDADVVYAAFMFFNPAVVAKMWNAGIAVAGAGSAARSYAESCARWGRARLGDFDAAERLAELAGRVVDGADVAAAGLTGLEAVLVGDGGSEAIAQLHGWPGESPEGRAHLRPRWERAEADTSAHMARLLGRTLDADERGELATLVDAAATAISRNS